MAKRLKTSETNPYNEHDSILPAAPTGGNTFKNLSLTGYMKTFKNFLPSPSPQQEQFAKDVFEIMRHDTDTSKVTVFPARCGIGKSIAIKALINHCIDNSDYGNYDKDIKSVVGLVIITDALERLNEYQIEDDEWGEPNYMRLQKQDCCTYIYCSSNSTKSSLASFSSSRL